MMHFRTAAHGLVFLFGLALGFGSPARADVISSPAGTVFPSSGSFWVGIDNVPASNQVGNLWDTPNGIGFFTSDGYDPIAFIPPRESWGVSDGAVSGYVDPNGSLLAPLRVKNITSISSNFTNPNQATVSAYLVNPANSANVLRIDQTYTFVANNVLKIAMQISNLDPSNPSGDVLVQRNVAWGITPFLTTPTEFVTVPPLSGQVVRATYDATTAAAASADPLGPYNFPSPPGGGTFGPLDLGAGITYDAGILAPMGAPGGGDVKTVNFFEAINTAAFDPTHGLGQSPSSLLAQVNALGGNFAILGFNAADPTGTPPNGQGTNSAILAVEVTLVPEPATFALFGLGLAGLVGWCRRRPA